MFQILLQYEQQKSSIICVKNMIRSSKYKRLNKVTCLSYECTSYSKLVHKQECYFYM